MMSRARRLLAGVLTLAVALFVAAAAAPAHAHTAPATHALHAVTLLEQSHHGPGGPAHAHAAPEVQPSGAEAGDRDRTAPNAPSDTVTHVHSCSQFVAAEPAGGPAPQLRVQPAAWPALDARAITNRSTPPRRPPRAFL
jgi:hypothetical protein